MARASDDVERINAAAREEAPILLERAGYQLVCKTADGAYYKHLDGKRLLVLTTDAHGAPKVQRLDS